MGGSTSAIVIGARNFTGVFVGVVIVGVDHVADVVEGCHDGHVVHSEGHI